MKKTGIRVFILCALMMLTGCFALADSPGETGGIPTEADCGSLRIRIEGPDDRMPMEISYEEFTDGSFSLTGLTPGDYTITEIQPEELLEGYSLQEDSEIRTTVTVRADGEATASLFNHYAPGTPENEENTDGEPEEETEYISVSLRKEWDDGENIRGLRPASVTVTLSNGSTYVLHEGNGWSVTVDHLPAAVDGQPVQYTWLEKPTPGYAMAYALTNGNHTTLINRLWQPPQVQEGKKQPRRTGTEWYAFDDYDTPLGVEIMINHVGDCYE